MSIESETAEERRELEAMMRSTRTPARLRERVRIVLKLLEGVSVREAARQLKMGRRTVDRWRRRFNEARVAGLKKDRPRRIPKGLSARKVKALLEATLHTTPEGATHWTTRTLAKAQGVSQSAVLRIWRAHGLKPHLIRSFKLSRDEQFVEKVEDVVGLYMNPPDNALVLSVDEKSQIQALDRTQPGLPLKRGRCGTHTHDYKRHGTTTLFTAMDLSSGRVVTGHMPRHRHKEFLRFMRLVETETPKHLDLHVILDNYGAHKHPAVQRWLRRHPRIHFHFIPTSSSWLNLVERWFRDLTTKAIRRGAFGSVDELIDAIDDYAKAWNEDPKPYIWRKTAQQIIASVMRGRHKLESLH